MALHEAGGFRRMVLDARLLTLVAAASALGVAAALPWATATQSATGPTITFGGGPLAVLIGACALTAAAAVGAMIWRRPARWMYSLVALTAAIALGACVVLALDTTSAANAMALAGPSRTSYSYGAAVGLVAAFVLIVTALACRPGAIRAEA